MCGCAVTDVPMFELPATKPLPKPTTRLEGVGPIKYAAYRPKSPVKCEDCLAVALEASRTAANAPLSRQARFKRSQGASKLLLCVEHKQGRETDELHAAVMAELRAAGGP
jgi:hypothetical protein